MKDIAPGIYPNLSNEDYHGHQGSYSKSSLSDFSIYPYKLKYEREQLRTPDADRKFDLGSAAHTAILEPEHWEKDVAVCPPQYLGKNGSRNTKAYREWEASVPHGIAKLTQSQRDKVLRIRDSVLENPAHSKAKELVTGGISELSCFWEECFVGDEVDEDTGYHWMKNRTIGGGNPDHKILMKTRPDHIPDSLVTVDLKTTAVAIDRENFEKQAYNLNYHWSAGLTLRGLTIATGKDHRVYIFVVVSTVPPHGVAVYRATQENIALGKIDSIEAMGRLAWCDKNNIWPWYPNKIHQLGLPAWGARKLYDYNK